MPQTWVRFVQLWPGSISESFPELTSLLKTTYHHKRSSLLAYSLFSGSRTLAQISSMKTEDVRNSSLVPRPHPLTRKRVYTGDCWALPWFCQVSNLDFWMITSMVQSHVFHWLASTHVWRCTISLACSELRLLTRHNQENAQWSPDPFPCERVGSGHKTREPEPGNINELEFVGDSKRNLVITRQSTMVVQLFGLVWTTHQQLRFCSCVGVQKQCTCDIASCAGSSLEKWRRSMRLPVTPVQVDLTSMWDMVRPCHAKWGEVT